MVKEQIKANKERFIQLSQQFVDMYMEMGSNPVIDKVLAKYSDIDDTLYTNWVKAYKVLFNPTKIEGNCLVFDKNKFQNFVNATMSMYQAFKNTLNAKSVDDGVMLKDGWVNVVDFTSKYVRYLKQCLSTGTKNKKKGTK